METLIGLALKSLLVAGATLGLLHLTRRRSAAERSLIAHLGLVALVALPLASLALPALHVDLPALSSAAPVVEQPVADPVRQPAIKADSVASTAPAPTVSAATPSGPAFDWTPYAYAAPAVALLLITLVALLRLFALRSRAQVLVDPTWLTALAHAQRRMGFKNGTALLTSSELNSPISWGLMRPVILLNDEALKASGEAEAIIAHELAHVARLDWAKLMLARVATAVFWFNPLAWVLAREAHQLREEAADDAVLAANIADTDYAQLLVGVARHECHGLLLGAHGVAPSKGSLRRRVSRVLDGTLARGPAGRSWIAGFAAGMLVMAAPLAALTFAPKEKLPEDSLIGKSGAERGQRTFVLNEAVGKVVADATSAAVAGVLHPDLSEEIAREVDKEAGRSLADADADHDDDSDDHLVAWKTLGITEQYAAAIRAAAPHLRIDDEDMVGFKAVGVTPAYVADLARAGLKASDGDDLVAARAVGVSGDYVRELRAAGFRGDLDEMIEMRAVGVNGDDIRRAKQKAAQLDSETIVRLKFKGHPGVPTHRVRPPAPPGPVPPPAAVDPARPASPPPAPQPL